MYELSKTDREKAIATASSLAPMPRYDPQASAAAGAAIATAYTFLLALIYGFHFGQVDIWVVMVAGGLIPFLYYRRQQKLHEKQVRNQIRLEERYRQQERDGRWK